MFRGWIKRYGCPQEIHSDQGSQFESQIFQEMCKLLEINKPRTTAYHPQSDGMIERTRTLVPRGTNRSAGAIAEFKLALYM